ncbi:hypothetical protein BDA99DRAFT_536424 [Phascolomyces articulosus]|uniref:Uncharacterized protein n=1 Tax=Phascolomyces articulosus TaxID=60185 RepID=A0AAD5K1N8_9FUNG|nr:hypothetical protein BDA99DRAFT_536424 [Phascolomyces articulosus]
MDTIVVDFDMVANTTHVEKKKYAANLTMFKRQILIIKKNKNTFSQSSSLSSSLSSSSSPLPQPFSPPPLLPTSTTTNQQSSDHQDRLLVHEDESQSVFITTERSPLRTPMKHTSPNHSDTNSLPAVALVLHSHLLHESSVGCIIVANRFG